MLFHSILWVAKLTSHIGSNTVLTTRGKPYYMSYQTNTLRLLNSYLLRHGLDYSEEDMHRSRIWGEWSNMIGYEMDSSPPTIYTTPMKKFQAWMGKKYSGQLSNTFATGVLQRSSFMSTLKLGQEAWPPENSNLRHFLNLFIYCFSIFSAILGRYMK